MESNARGDAVGSVSSSPPDPPEEIFEMSPYPSSSHRKYKSQTSGSSSNGNNLHTIYNDNHLDEFEIEGLIMSSHVGSNKSLGPSSQRRTTIVHKIYAYCSPLIAICYIPWSTRNRSRSTTIALLFVAFICMILLTENDVSAWHRSFFSRTNSKSGRGNTNDPFTKLTSDQRTSLLQEIYGSWTFFDGGAEDRPTEPYMTIENAGNPYLDLPEDKFPLESWQADAVYANHFLDAAEKLVKRGQQAIFSTYHGYGLSDVHVTTIMNGEEEEEEKVDYTLEEQDARSSLRRTMFHIEEIDLDTVTSTSELQSAAPSWEEKGGWTTQRSFDGLERRIIHAIMTESNFTVVVTGSWQSMGYGGNHAFQSMAGVFESLVKGLFDKLGVNLVVRAIGLPPLNGESNIDGGKSTLLHTMGWSSIYGSDVDMVVWDDYNINDDDDSDLDEISKQMFDLFARQALLSGTTNLPFIWGGEFEVLRNLHQYADADVGQLGNGIVGVPETTSEKEAYNLPWAARYLKCPESMQSTCDKEDHQFESQCWVDRSDVTPPTSQLDHIPILPQAIGWRMQQLKGYSLAYVFLTATLDALLKFSEITISQGFPLADEHWHMGEYIQNVQEKVKTLDESVAPHCFQLLEMMDLPKRLCQHRMHGRAEYTPRANPSETSVRSILDDATVQVDPKTIPQLLYEGDDVDNPIRSIPEGEVDAYELFDLQGKRRRLLNDRNDVYSANPTHNATIEIDTYYSNNANARYSQRRRMDEVTPGEGWQLLHSYGDGCDGSLSSSNTCGRVSSNNCLLEGHQGSRGGIWGNETTGWLVFQPITIKNRYIALNLDIGKQNELPDSFVFEYSVDGVITTLDKTQFMEKLKQPVPGANLLTLYDTSTETPNVKIAVRVKGCDEDEVENCRFAVTHVYWS